MSGVITRTLSGVTIANDVQGIIQYTDTVGVTDVDGNVHIVNTIVTDIGPYKPSEFGGYTLNTAADLAVHHPIIGEIAEGLWTDARAAAHLAALPANIV